MQEFAVAEWPDTERRIYQASMAGAAQAMMADVQIDCLRNLLARCLKSVEGGKWRDKAGLSAEAHPVWDDVREMLRAK